MKRLLIPFLLLASTPWFISCDDSNDQTKAEVTVSPVDSLRNVVMDLHNEEMGKMGQMMAQEKQLKELIAEIDSSSNPEAYQALQVGIMTLDSGSFSMKSWMRNWKEPDTLASIADQLEGLEFQHDFMKRTSVLMRKGIEMAENLINEYGTNE